MITQRVDARQPPGPDLSSAAADAAQRRADALRGAAARKSAEALDRAEAALRAARRAGGAVTFASVAREAHVTGKFLRSHPDLRDRIERLRTSSARAAPAAAGDARGGTVAAVLRDRIKRLERDNATLRATVRARDEDLARLRGQMLSARSPGPGE